MPRERRLRDRGVPTWLGYRLDRFLGLGLAVQLAVLLALGFAIALLFGCAVFLMSSTDPTDDVPTVTDGLWWAVTRILDGGTVAADRGFAKRGFGVGVTLVGLVAVAFLTGGIASSLTERLRTIRAGRLPILERGHTLVLGYNARAGVLVRELARSGHRGTVVVVSRDEREHVEEALREQLLGIEHRLGIIVRCGDTTTTATVRRAAAQRARVVVVLADGDGRTGRVSPPPGQADRAVLRSLLALRRVLGDRRLPTVVEVSGPRGRALVGLCDAKDLVVVDAQGVNARVLAHAARETGAFEVARQILSLDGRNVYVHPSGPFAGLAFADAHASLDGGLLIGLLREDGPLVCPSGDVTIGPEDRLLVFAHDPSPPRSGPRRPSAAAPPQGDEDHAPARLDLLIVRFKPEALTVLRTLDETCEVSARILVDAASADGARAAVATLSLPRSKVTLTVGDPLDGEAIDRALEPPPHAALLLAPDVAAGDVGEADADQLVALLHVQRALQRHARDGTQARAPRIVVEVRSPETTRLAAGAGAGPKADFVLTRELVGMLLAHEVHFALRHSRRHKVDGRPSGGTLDAIYQDLFDALGPEIRLRPLIRYARGKSLPTFSDLEASARAVGEIALGVAEEGGPPHLAPGRDARFAVDPGSRLVVLTHGGAGPAT